LGLLEPFSNFFEAPDQVFPFPRREVFVGKIQRSLYRRRHSQKLSSEGKESPSPASPQSPLGGVKRLVVPRPDESQHPFCLGQVQAAIEKGPLGELPRSGGTTSQVQDL